MNSLLSTSLARHGRRRLRPSTSSSIIQPSPLLGSNNWGNTNDDDDDITTKNSRRRISIAQSKPCRNNRVCCNPTYHLTSPSLSPLSSSILSSASTSAAATSRRNYHSTSKQHILPFLAVGIVGAGVIYTYRTFQQIDHDWEEYYHELEEYKAVTGIDPEAAGGSAGARARARAGDAGTNAARVEDDLSHFFTGGILAIDMGTTRLKLSHRPSLAHGKNQIKKPPSPSVSVDREGFRSTPSLVWMSPPSSSNNGQTYDGGKEEEMLVGRLAMERSYDTKGGTIIHPRASLLGELEYSKEEGVSSNTAAAEAAVQQSIRSVATNALDQVLGTNSNNTNAGSSSSSANNTNPLFVLDESMSARGSGSYNVRPILTYPPSSTTTNTTTTTEDDYLTQYRQSVNGLTSPAGIAEFVPEPVAIACGAEYYNLLPSKDAGSSSVLVVDVGGSSTCVSIVGGEGGDEEEVLYSATLPFGGDTFVDLLVSHLADGFYGTTNNNVQDDKSSESTTRPSSKPTLNDPSALQRLYEASTTAIHELSNKTRSEINIPYLTMDLTTRQPKHLEVGVSRNVIDAEVQTWVREKLVPHLLQGTTSTDFTTNNSLSQALPSPTNLSTLFSSAIMNSLECTSLTPHALRAVILVGGGARVPLVRESMREGLVHLAGDAYVSGSAGNGEGRLIMPEGEMGEELGVLGAAVWGSGGR